MFGARTIGITVTIALKFFGCGRGYGCVSYSGWKRPRPAADVEIYVDAEGLEDVMQIMESGQMGYRIHKHPLVSEEKALTSD